MIGNHSVCLLLFCEGNECISVKLDVYSLGLNVSEVYVRDSYSRRISIVNICNLLLMKILFWVWLCKRRILLVKDDFIMMN